ncbi:MAG: preprotein translocase subunit SecG [Patescibacteria group bacterium]
MDLLTVLNIVEIIVIVLLIITILLQQKGSGLGSAFGGGSDNIYATKRGAEKFIYYSSIVLAVLFLAIALASFLIQK